MSVILVIAAVALAALFNPVWIRPAQERSGVPAITGWSSAEVERITGSVVADVLLGPPQFDVSDSGGQAVLGDAEQGHMQDVYTVLRAFALVLAAGWRCWCPPPVAAPIRGGGLAGCRARGWHPRGRGLRHRPARGVLLRRGLPGVPPRVLPAGQLLVRPDHRAADPAVPEPVLDGVCRSCRPRRAGAERRHVVPRPKACAIHHFLAGAHLRLRSSGEPTDRHPSRVVRGPGCRALDLAVRARCATSASETTSTASAVLNIPGRCFPERRSTRSGLPPGSVIR